jgi:predicted MFS family arabinose efflux permease
MVIGIFSAIGTIVSGWLTDRLDARRLLACYYGVRAVSLMFLPLLLAPTVAPSMVFWVVVYGLIDVATVPPTIAICRQLYGEDSAVVFGWVNAAHQIGAGMMAVFGGVVRDEFGSYDMVGIAAGCLCIGAAVIAYTLKREPVPA